MLSIDGGAPGPRQGKDPGLGQDGY